MRAQAADQPHGAGPALPAAARTLVMGILNVTPDSFSDGGLYASPDAAIARGLALAAAGADIVDVGGESTRPGAQRVEPARGTRARDPRGRGAGGRRRARERRHDEGRHGARRGGRGCVPHQ